MKRLLCILALIFGLKSVIIPNSLISIGNYAFNRCTALESIVIPSNVCRPILASHVI